MTATYPTGIVSLTAKTDGVDEVEAANINELQEEITAIETGLLTWTAFTTSTTNITIGSGTVVTRYIRLGKVIIWRGTLTFAANSSFGGTIAFSLPFQAANQIASLGSAYAVDAAARFYIMIPRIDASGTTLTTFLIENNATSAINATNPMTWAVNDTLTWQISYESAT